MSLYVVPESLNIRMYIILCGENTRIHTIVYSRIQCSPLKLNLKNRKFWISRGSLFVPTAGFSLHTLRHISGDMPSKVNRSLPTSFVFT